MDPEGFYSFDENALEYPTDDFTGNSTVDVAYNHWNLINSHGQCSDETFQDSFTDAFGAEIGTVNDLWNQCIFDGEDPNSRIQNQPMSYSDNLANCKLNALNDFECTVQSASQEITESPFNVPSSDITQDICNWQHRDVGPSSLWPKRNTGSSHENTQYSLKNSTAYLKSWNTPTTAGTHWPTSYSLVPTSAWEPKAEDPVTFDQSVGFPGADPGFKSSNHISRMGGLPGPDPTNALSYLGLGDSLVLDPLSISVQEPQNGLWQNHSPIGGMALETLLGQWGGRCPWPNCESTAILKTQKLLETHLYNLHINPLRCHIHGCRYTKPFAKQGDLNRHIETIHKQSRIFRCPQKNCERNKRGYSRKDKLKLHLKEHSHWPFKCLRDYCTEGFLTKGELDSHVQTTGHLPFRCPGDHCEEGFLTNSELKSHMEKRGHLPFKCLHKFCEEGFLTNTELDSHVERSGHWPFECPYCWKVFLTKTESDSHMDKRGHWPFKCEFDSCNEKFLTNNELDSHLERGHGRFICPLEYCRQKFWKKSELESHMDIRGHWPFECPYNSCKEGFRTKGEMESHVEKRGHCPPKCRYVSGSEKFGNGQLESHIDGRGHRLFKCLHTSCNEVFYTKGEFESHAETRDHPFKCLFSHCSKKFFTIDEMVDHKAGSDHGAWECAVGDCAGSTSQFSCMNLAKHLLGFHSEHWQQPPLSPKEIHDKIRHFTNSSSHTTGSPRHISGPDFRTILGPNGNIGTWCRCTFNRPSESETTL